MTCYDNYSDKCLCDFNIVGRAGTAGLGMAGVQYSQQPTPSLAMLQPALPELSTVISQFEAAAIHNAGGMATPALLMQVRSILKDE